MTDLDPPIHSGENQPSRHPELVSGSMTCANIGMTRWQRFKAQIARKVAPLWVGLFDQIDLPLSAPILDLLLPRNRRFHSVEYLEMDKALGLVARRKSASRNCSVLEQASRKIGSNTRVKRPAKSARQNVSAGLPFALHMLHGEWRWMLESKTAFANQFQHDGDGIKFS